MREIWKPIKGFEDKYEISNMGRIKSLSRTIINNGGEQHTKQKILKNNDNGHGYLFVNLCKNNKIYRKYVHRLVAQHFIKNTNNYPEVNHINENSYDNNASNLEWCTSKYNANYGNRNIKMKKTKRQKYGRLVKQYDLNGNFIKKMYMYEAIKLNGVYYANLRKCCNKEYNSCGGFIWRYTNE